ncbi:uncharacterized protein K452DRAFT_317383 [Aplosporella prunicola CBS 121167]|uniref:DUF7924 domain-containing protein n=1 Tax=Aplosporella prunicola CBS 121167 TaxID=1176127 RepID=A0A6A6BGA4_9PEZI|nr:uncharacterized protein K452DRAFT_317383 [Aplosporella prunicola CBS 121167]KAF2143169.1 hypothetical protein K452DRAFT_317383 [Aplosporella prunicola CBS 121167]
MSTTTNRPRYGAMKRPHDLSSACESDDSCPRANPPKRHKPDSDNNDDLPSHTSAPVNDSRGDVTTEEDGGGKNLERAPSPETVSAISYRNDTLAAFNIVVGSELPPRLKEWTDGILEWARKNVADWERFRATADEWRRTSTDIDSRSLGKEEWTSSLQNAITGVMSAQSDDLVHSINSSAMAWVPVLLPRERKGFSAPKSGLKTPRPDSYVGFTTAAFTTGPPFLSNYFLSNLNICGAGHASTPSPDPLDCRYPFLIIEATSGATGGLLQAQNQAALSGACALNILQGLKKMGAKARRSSHDTTTVSKRNREKREHYLADRTLKEQRDAWVAAASKWIHPQPPQLAVFSLTTDSSVHELWIHHFNAAKEYRMSRLGVFDSTDPKSQDELLVRLAAIAAWADGEFRDWLADNLGEYAELSVKGRL